MVKGQNTGQNSRNPQRPAKKKNTTRFRPYMRVKLVVFCFIVVAAVLGLVGRLIYITSTSEERYKKQVLSQQKYDSTTLPYKRGSILDRNGSTMAYSEKVYNVILDTKVMLDDEANYNPTLNALDICFDVDIEEIKAYVAAKPDSQYYKVALQVSYDDKAAYEAYVEEQEKLALEAAKAAGVKNTGAHIKGIWFEEEYLRKYPYNTLASDVLGFTGKDNAGQFGLEEYYNDVLNGTTGREYGYLNSDSELKRTIKPADNGHTIVSTLDLNIQTVVEKVIDQYNEELRDNYRTGPGAEDIGVIVMDIHTGGVYAMATNERYDCSNPYDLSLYYSQESIDAMKKILVNAGTGEVLSENASEEEKSKAISQYAYELNQIWRNFCLSDTYEPGSVAKPFTVAMCLEEGVVNDNDSWICNGSLYVGGYDIECHEKSGHGTVGLSYSIQESCNVAMMYMSERLGAADFAKYQNAFGFGLKSNIDLTGEARTASLIHTIDTMGVTELATSSFGQGFQVTMTQMAASFASLVNGGYLYQPQMVRQILDENGNVVQNVEPFLIKQTVSEETSAKIVQYCNATVVDGTGEKARPAGYAIGGKTGTSETLPRGSKDYVVSFMGYAPADDPQVLIYTVVNKPNVEDQSLATKYACWISRDILAEILPYMNIFMTEELTEEEQQAITDRQNAVIEGYQNKRDEEAAQSSEDTAQSSGN